MYENYLKEKLDEIKFELSKHQWVQSYHIFLQSLKSLTLDSFDGKTQSYNDHLSMGYSLRLISTNRRLIELSSSISQLDLIRDLSPPKSTQEMISVAQFPKLKKPHSTAVPGDFSNTVDIETNPNEMILNQALNHASDYHIPFSHIISVQLETRIVATSGSISLSENALRTNYNISTQFDIHNRSFNLSRSSMSRSLDLDVKSPITSLVNSTINRIKLSPISVEKSPAVLFHPESFGGLLSRIFADTQLSQDQLEDQYWSDKIQIYDDPLRTGGYYSTLFDDEGILTRPKQLVAGGNSVGKLVDLHSNNWHPGGNGYRVSLFHPRIRSYQHSVKPSISNLVVSGGTGKGEYFTDRPGKLLLIRQGFSYNISLSGEFILHVNEAEIWEDGDLVGPVHNLTINGSIKDIFGKGHFSSDEISVVDRTLPGSVYCGWIIIPPSTVVIRS